MVVVFFLVVMIGYLYFDSYYVNLLVKVIWLLDSL